MAAAGPLRPASQGAARQLRPRPGGTTDALEPLLPQMPGRQRRAMARSLAAAVVRRLPPTSLFPPLGLPELRGRPAARPLRHDRNGGSTELCSARQPEGAGAGWDCHHDLGADQAWARTPGRPSRLAEADGRPCSTRVSTAPASANWLIVSPTSSSWPAISACTEKVSTPRRWQTRRASRLSYSGHTTCRPIEPVPRWPSWRSPTPTSEPGYSLVAGAPPVPS